MDFSSTYISQTLNQAQSSLGQKRAQEALNEITKAGKHPEQSAREVAEDFEAVFLNTMVESMFSGIKTDGPFGGGYGEGVYRSMLNQQYAKAIAKSGGIGIADKIYDQILQLQAQQNQPAALTPIASAKEPDHASRR